MQAHFTIKFTFCNYKKEEGKLGFQNNKQQKLYKQNRILRYK